MTIRELLQSPFLRGAKVLAGHNGLDNEVTWAAPETEIEFNQWIMPGLLLLHTPDYEVKPWDETSVKIDKAKPAGFLLFPDTLTEVMQSVIANKDFCYYSEKKTPLILLPRGVTMLSFSKHFTSFMSTHFLNEYHRDEWLREITFNTNSSVENTTGISYGYNPKYDYYCLILKVSSSSHPNYIQGDMRLSSVRNFISEVFSYENANVLSFIDSSTLILYLPDSHNVHNTIRNRITNNIKKLFQVFPTLVATICVGTSAHSLSEFSRSYYNAKKTLEIIHTLQINENVNFYDDWYMHMLLLNAPKDELRIQSKKLLDPILTEPELVETLENYLEYGENLKLTAENLFIHINTLKYRIQRINKLLNCNLKDPNVRFRLRIALIIEHYLKNIL